MSEYKGENLYYKEQDSSGKSRKDQYEEAADALYRTGSTEQWPMQGLILYWLEALEGGSKPAQIFLDACKEKRDYAAIAMLSALLEMEYAPAAKQICELYIYGNAGDHFDYDFYLRNCRNSSVFRNTFYIALGDLVKAGDGDAMAEFAMCIWNSEAVDNREEQADHYLREAEECGCRRAAQMRQYLHASSEEKEQAGIEFEAYRDLGFYDPAYGKETLYICSEWAAIGRGTPYSLSDSLEFLEKAAAAGNTKAMLEASDFYRKPRILMNAEKYLDYAAMAADYGEPEGFLKLGQLFERLKDPAKSRFQYEYYLKAEEGGNAEAGEKCDRLRTQREERYSQAKRSISIGLYNDAYYLLYPLALCKEAGAINLCADLILKKKVTNIDREEVLQILEMDYTYAGNKMVSYILCKMYAAVNDDKQTMNWGKKAIRDGFKDAYYVIACLFLTQRNYNPERYVKQIQEGALNGSPICALRYASFYEDPDFKNITFVGPYTAIEYARFAVDHGLKAAQEIIDRIEFEELCRAEQSRMRYEARRAAAEERRRFEEEQSRQAFVASVGDTLRALNDLNRPFTAKDMYGNEIIVDPLTGFAGDGVYKVRVNSDNLYRMQAKRRTRALFGD